MRVIVIEPTKAPELRDIELTAAIVNELVGGYFEMYRFSMDVGAYINEDGKQLNLPINIIASQWCDAHGTNIYPDHICGTMVIFGTRAPDGTLDGYEHDIPQSFIELVKSELKQ